MIEARAPLRNRSDGFSLVEILVAIIILSGSLLGLVAGTFQAARYLGDGKHQLTTWAAMQTQMEQLASQGYAGVTSGSATVDGHPMSWDVSGVDPKIVVLVAERRSRFGPAVLDSLVMHFSAADTL